MTGITRLINSKKVHYRFRLDMTFCGINLQTKTVDKNYKFDMSYSLCKNCIRVKKIHDFWSDADKEVSK